MCSYQPRHLGPCAAQCSPLLPRFARLIPTKGRGGEGTELRLSVLHAYAIMQVSRMSAATPLERVDVILSA